MRILHISDFHLSNDENSIAKSQKIVDALLESIDTVQKEHKIDLVVFSGDAIHKGGSDFDSLEEAFLSFQTILIEPLMEKIQLPLGNFIWCIGNHDIDRKQDSKFLEAGLADNLKTLQDVDLFFNSNDWKDVKRIEQDRLRLA